jgi:hypothetical protein
MGRLSSENFTEFDQARAWRAAPSFALPQSPQVLERMHDLVGIRITSYFPSLEIPQIIKVNLCTPRLLLPRRRRAHRRACRSSNFTSMSYQ